MNKADSKVNKNKPNTIQNEFKNEIELKKINKNHNNNMNATINIKKKMKENENITNKLISPEILKRNKINYKIDLRDPNMQSQM